MRVTARVNIELAKSTNYIPMGFWEATTDYYLSDLGIPFVKRPDGSTLGYSVFALNVQQATKGSWIASEWRLIESAEFMYMQEAYIEHLQAELITAQKIESLLIRTGNLEVLNGAKIAGMGIENDNIVSNNKKLIIDGLNNTIYLKDALSDDIRTVIRPNKLPLDPSAFFAGASKSATIAGLKSTIAINGGTLSSNSISIVAGESYIFNIPQVNLTAYVNAIKGQQNPLNPDPVAAVSEARLILTNGSLVIPIGSAWVATVGGEYSDTSIIQATTRLVSSPGNWYLSLQYILIPGGPFQSVSGSASLTSSATNMTASPVINRSEIGSNGMIIADSNQSYTFMVGDTFQVRRGNNILQITSSVMRKSSDGGSSWINL